MYTVIVSSKLDRSTRQNQWQLDRSMLRTSPKCDIAIVSPLYRFVVFFLFFHNIIFIDFILFFFQEKVRCYFFLFSSGSFHTPNVQPNDSGARIDFTMTYFLLRSTGMVVEYIVPISSYTFNNSNSGR